MARERVLQTVSVNLPTALIERVRRLGFDESFSTSSIVEQALLKLLDNLSDEELGTLLRSLGASLRRGDEELHAVSGKAEKPQSAQRD